MLHSLINTNLEELSHILLTIILKSALEMRINKIRYSFLTCIALEILNFSSLLIDSDLKHAAVAQRGHSNQMLHRRIASVELALQRIVR